MINEKVRALPLYEMQRMSDASILRWDGGKELKATLDILALGCFLDRGGRYWFGSVLDDFPEHCRWFYVVESVEVQTAGSWPMAVVYDVEYGVPVLNRGGDSMPNDLLFEMQEMDSIIANVISRIPGVLTAHRDETGSTFYRDHRFQLRHKALQAWATFGILGVSPKTLQLEWGDDMHDMICHYDRWLPEHAEFTGMPQNIVLRMHGLSQFADAVSGLESNSWLANKHCDQH